MPFALNESTRFISPTKTLEYMASEKPVVSTPVHDVMQLYGAQVALANAGKACVDACDTLLAETAQARQRRAEAMLQTVFTRSWDHTVAEVNRLLRAACAGVEVALEADDSAAAAAAAAAATGTHSAAPRSMSL